MYKLAEQRLTRLISSQQYTQLVGGLVGLEKEGLRVSAAGKIAQTPHPIALGSALTHPYITTDYSEALLELITPPCHSAREALDFLDETHRYVYSKLQEELIWATSMPCIVSGEASIRIAEYGPSNPGMMKHIYRRGLGYRYGKMMQVIAGIHYNYSLAETFWPIFKELEHDKRTTDAFRADAYFGMIRNLQRYGWLIPYLFGASPTVCKSFVKGVSTGLEEFDENTYYQPYATSLRLGDIGYQNKKEGEAGIHAVYDNLNSYVDSLIRAVKTPYQEYQRIGVKVDDDYRQLNSNLLQIENEYYSTIRPKQITEPMEAPSLALRRRGVRYVELRSIDVNVYEPMGISAAQLDFLEAFLLFCLLQESPLIQPTERSAINDNLTNTAHRGRTPGLNLTRVATRIKLQTWGLELLDAMQGLCDILDKATQSRRYTNVLAQQRMTLQDPDRTPSARILKEMREQGEAFFPFSVRYSKQHQRKFLKQPLDQQRRAFFDELGKTSLHKQHNLEANTTMDLERYLAQYFAQFESESSAL